MLSGIVEDVIGTFRGSSQFSWAAATRQIILILLCDLIVAG